MEIFSSLCLLSVGFTIILLCLFGRLFWLLFVYNSSEKNRHIEQQKKMQPTTEPDQNVINQIHIHSEDSEPRSTELEQAKVTTLLPKSNLPPIAEQSREVRALQQLPPELSTRKGSSIVHQQKTYADSSHHPNQSGIAVIFQPAIGIYQKIMKKNKIVKAEEIAPESMVDYKSRGVLEANSERPIVNLEPVEQIIPVIEMPLPESVDSNEPQIRITLFEPEFEAPEGIDLPELEKELVEKRQSFENKVNDWRRFYSGAELVKRVNIAYIDYQNTILQIFINTKCAQTTKVTSPNIDRNLKLPYVRQSYFGYPAKEFSNRKVYSCVIASALNACKAVGIPVQKTEGDAIKFLNKIFNETGYDRNTGYLGLFSAALVAEWLNATARTTPFNIVDVVIKTLNGHAFVYGRGHAKAIVGVNIVKEYPKTTVSFLVIDPISPETPKSVPAESIIEQLGFVDAAMVEIFYLQESPASANTENKNP